MKFNPPILTKAARGLVPAQPVVLKTPKNHMSRKPGTFYGEILAADIPYDPFTYSAEIWDNLPKAFTKVDIQFDDCYQAEALHVFYRNGIAVPEGYKAARRAPYW